MITKKIITPLLLVIILAGIGGVFAAKKTAEQRLSRVEEATTTTSDTQTVITDDTMPSSGRYEQYSEDKVSEAGYTQTILFFHAGWCPECRAFKQAINSEDIPAGVQILEVNYDQATDLKKQHAVTLQSTFVKVDPRGTQVSKWVGYGKNKSLDTVLNNL